MSVILDVLKKLDREKVSRRDHLPNIAAEILRPDLPREKRRIPLQMIVALTAVVTVAITYVSLREFGLISRPSPPIPSRPPESKHPVQPAPESSFQTKPSPPLPVIPSEPVQKVLPTPSFREPAPELKEEVIKVIPKTETVPDRNITKGPDVSVESKPSSPPSMDKRSDQGGIPAKKEIIPVEPPKKSPETRVTEPAKGPPPLTLSAIVWYEDPALRFAIVNGVKAVEGDLIEGAKVVEIHRTSIRFLYQEKPFEISISR